MSSLYVAAVAVPRRQMGSADLNAVLLFSLLGLALSLAVVSLAPAEVSAAMLAALQ
jgi:hypothetical protein